MLTKWPPNWRALTGIRVATCKIQFRTRIQRETTWGPATSVLFLNVLLGSSWTNEACHLSAMRHLNSTLHTSTSSISFLMMLEGNNFVRINVVVAQVLISLHCCGDRRASPQLLSFYDAKEEGGVRVFQLLLLDLLESFGLFSRTTCPIGSFCWSPQPNSQVSNWPVLPKFSLKMC